MARPSRFVAASLFAASASFIALSVGDLPRLPAQLKAPPVAPPTYPTLTTLTNLGAKRGGSVDVVLTGTNLTDVTGVWASFSAKITIPPGQKDAAKVNVKLDIPADAPIGLHTLRVATSTGVTNLKPFTVDELPQVVEDGKNKAKTAPQTVTLPVVVTGTVEAETGDFFKFPVKAGEPVTIEVLARRLGSGLDPVLILYDGSGKELGGVYADDTPGLQSDARVIYTPKAAGDLVVEVRSTTYGAGEYRLRLGAFPGATTAFPLAIERGKTAPISFTGPGTEAVKPVSVTAPADLAAQVVYATPRSAAGVAGWPVPVRISDNPELAEAEPNNDAAKATKLPVPGGVSARFLEKNDVDYFSFPGKKGQKYSIEVHTYEVNSPAEVFLRVLDAKGTELAKSNPTQAGLKLEYAPTADGDYLIACEHLNYAAGPNEVYHLSVKPALPDFAVTVGLDRADVALGGVGTIPIVGVTRLNGFAAPIDVSLVGMDGVAGTVTIPPGLNLLPLQPVFLPVTPKAGAKPGLFVGQVRATAKIDGKDVVRVATLLDVAKASLGGMPNPPAEVLSQVAVALIPEPPLTVTVAFEKAEVLKGGTIKGTVTAKRGAMVTEEVVIASVYSPPNVTAKLKPVAKGATTAEVELTAAAAAAVGPAQLLFRGTTKVGGKDLGYTTAPISITVTEPAKKK